jgi:hypothetical protein
MAIPWVRCHKADLPARAALDRLARAGVRGAEGGAGDLRMHAVGGVCARRMVQTVSRTWLVRRDSNAELTGSNGVARKFDAKSCLVQEQPKALSVPSQHIVNGPKQGGAIGRVEPRIILIELAAALGVIATALTDELWSPPVSLVTAKRLPAIHHGTCAGRDGQDKPGHDGERAVLRRSIPRAKPDADHARRTRRNCIWNG